jgi:hypothetical protein
MIVIYRGAGFWVLIVLLGICFVTMGIWDAVTGGVDNARMVTGLGLVVGGRIVWWWGEYVNRHHNEAVEAERKRLDGAVANEPPAAPHSLYGIPVEVWGIFAIILGVVFVLVGLLTGS